MQDDRNTVMRMRICIGYSVNEKMPKRDEDSDDLVGYRLLVHVLVLDFVLLLE